jgi:hypothetical protein
VMFGAYTLPGKPLARAQCVRHQRRIVRRPIVFRMAAHAIGHRVDQVCSACQAFRRALKLGRGQCARPRSNEWTPSDRERDPGSRNDDQRGEHPPRTFASLFIRNFRFRPLARASSLLVIQKQRTCRQSGPASAKPQGSGGQVPRNVFGKRIAARVADVQ